MIWPMEWIGPNAASIFEAVTILTIILLVLAMTGIKLFNIIEATVKEWRRRRWWNE
jgi:hypothetical protein